MRVAIASDHEGFDLKEELKQFLADEGHLYIDFGCYSKAEADSIDFALRVATGVMQGLFDRGIVIDGTGVGPCVAANKLPGVRAALCHDLSTVLAARQQVDANVLALGEGQVGRSVARQICQAFFDSAFRDGGGARLVAKIRGIEAQYLRPPGHQGRME